MAEQLCGWLSQVLCQLFDLGNSKATSIQVQRGSRTWNKFAPGEASKQSPSRKPLQSHCLSCVDTWLGKPFATLRLSMITIYKLQASVANCRLTVLLVHRISCAILGSQNALIKVGEVLRLWPAVIAILPSLEPQQLSNISRDYSLSLGQRNVFNTIRLGTWWVRIDHANTSCSISLVCWRESRTTTPICGEEWCSGVVLAMTSKPSCLKSSQVDTGQLLLPTNLKLLKLYVA